MNNAISKHEASKIAGVTISCINKWLRKYPYIKLKVVGKTFISKSALLSLIEPKQGAK